MGKALIISEKPSVARDIVDALGGFTGHDNEYWESDRFLCTFAVGHIVELLEPEEINADYKRWTFKTLPIIPEQFKLKAKHGQGDRLKTIKKLMERKDVDELINACDAGREGELIFRELVDFFGSKKPIRRLWLQSMTPTAIRTGFANLEDGKKFEGLGFAAQCRSQADWLIGMNATRAMTIRLKSKTQKQAWSAGRVQTPTLSLLVERELEVLSHIPKAYWRVLADFKAAGHQYQGTWFDPNFKESEGEPERKSDRIFDEAQAQAIVAAVVGKPGLASETRKPSRESAPPLFDLTSLQREANRRFSWTARRTLQAAQRCYETHKILTYPRTDSRCLPNDYVPHVENVLKVLSAGTQYAPSAMHLIKNGRQNDAKVFDDKGVSDHHAIIPTGELRSLQGDDAKLFDLVTRRFLSAFFPPAVWEQVERTTVVAQHHFLTRARSLKEAGWRSVLEQTSTDESSLPALVPGTDAAKEVPATTQNVESESDETKPPPRITESRLLSLMENAGKSIEDENLVAVMHDKGLGTPATRADIIENLKSKGYVDDSLRPTVKGIRFIDLLHRIDAARLTSAELTGELELHLNEVERGKRRPEQFMSEINEYAKEIVESVSGFDFGEIYPDRESLGKCPLCSRPVYERSWFYRCKEPAGLIDPFEVAESLKAAGASAKEVTAAKKEAAEKRTQEDCPFRVWKDRSGRYIDHATAHLLLTEGKTGVLDGFCDMRGRTFKGILKLVDGQVELESVGGPDASGAPSAVTTFEVNDDPVGPCPIHKDAGCQVVETPTDFICQTRLTAVNAGEKKPQGLILPRMVCKREITRSDAASYVTTGETPLIEDFISRFGRPFKAKLKLAETGRHTFEFPPREAGAGGGGRGRGRWGKKKTEGESPAADASATPEATEAAPKPKRAVKKKAAPKKSTRKPASS